MGHAIRGTGPHRTQRKVLHAPIGACVHGCTEVFFVRARARCSPRGHPKGARPSQQEGDIVGRKPRNPNPGTRSKPNTTPPKAMPRGPQEESHRVSGSREVAAKLPEKLPGGVPDLIGSLKLEGTSIPKPWTSQAKPGRTDSNRSHVDRLCTELQLVRFTTRAPDTSFAAFPEQKAG